MEAIAWGFLYLCAGCGLLALGLMAGFWLYLTSLRKSYESGRLELSQTLEGIQKVHNQQVINLQNIDDKVGMLSLQLMGSKK